MLKTRIITAAILLPLVLGLFIFGQSWFVVLFLLASTTLAVFEGAHILIPAFERRLDSSWTGFAGYPEGTARGAAFVHRHRYEAFLVVLAWVVLLGGIRGGTSVASMGLAGLAMVLVLLVGVFSSRNVEMGIARSSAMLVALVYGVFPWLAVWALYQMGGHSRYVFLVMTVVFLTDTGGYFGGRYFGGKIFGDRKLAPSLSPKKTWEGAFAGTLSAVAGALILNLVYLGGLGEPGHLALVALTGSVAGQFGDLVESAFKRFAGVKDSGVIFPGHGGFLDRADGILFASPVIWAMLYFLK